jgi:cytoskeletal protein CcmA (bactofilin family)
MFRRKGDTPAGEPADRVDSVVGSGLALSGTLGGVGGVRIEGAFEGDIDLQGLVVVGEQGRVTCKRLRAQTVIVAGSVRGDITTQRLEITHTGRVWGDVVTAAFSTEEGAFLRGQITMEEKVELGTPDGETGG